jgi:hypothetical protein
LSNASSPVSPCWRGEWLKSSYSSGSSSCVEVKFAVDGILVRDSKDKRDDQPMISVSRTAWISLLNTIS